MFFTTTLFTLHFPVETFYQYNPFTISPCWFLSTGRCLETSVLLFEMEVTHPWKIQLQDAGWQCSLFPFHLSVTPTWILLVTLRGWHKVLFPRILGELQPSSAHPPSPWMHTWPWPGTLQGFLLNISTSLKTTKKDQCWPSLGNH